MNVKQRLEKAGATPAKLALIGVLSLVLVGVIIMQLPEATSGLSTPETPAQLANTKKTEKKDSSDGRKKQQLRPWPNSNLATTLANNPFAQPNWAMVGEVADPTAAVATADVPGDLAELQEQGASIVVIGAGRKLAEIGDQRFDVGDILEGYRVTDITTQGILLDKLEQ
ncbi:MAG: hypothetical protein ACR2NM_01195 [Bythopirellula sp.]